MTKRSSTKTAIEPAELIPDATYSRNVSFNLVERPQGARLWTGRLLADLLVYLAQDHPEGVLAEIEGLWYKVSVERHQKDNRHG